MFQTSCNTEIKMKNCVRYFKCQGYCLQNLKSISPREAEKYLLNNNLSEENGKLRWLKKIQIQQIPLCLFLCVCNYLCCGGLNFVLNQWHCIAYLSASGLKNAPTSSFPSSFLFCLNPWLASLENKTWKYMVQWNFALRNCEDLPLSKLITGYSCSHYEFLPVCRMYFLDQ